MDPLALRVAERFGATRTWKIDRTAINRKLKQWNVTGNYKLVIVPISKINVPPTRNSSSLEPLRSQMRKGKPIDPVRLTLTGSKYDISAGAESTIVAQQMGFTHVPAIVFTDPPKQTPERPLLQVGDWVKLRSPENGRIYGWVDGHISARLDRGVKRGVYGIALIGPDSVWPEFIDLRDTDFEPTSPPLWGPSVRSRMDSR